MVTRNFLVLSLVCAGCSSSIGPEATPDTQENTSASTQETTDAGSAPVVVRVPHVTSVTDAVDAGSAPLAQLCDLTHNTSTYGVQFANPVGTCPSMTGTTMLYTLPYLTLGAGTCAGPQGHTVKVSADGCTVTSTCDYVEDYEERYTQVITFSPDLTKVTGTLVGEPVDGGASCTGSWDISGSLL